MIRVNLLPPERRRPERTPLPRLLLILTAVALTAIVAGVVGLAVFRWLGVKGEIEGLQKEKAVMRDNVAKHAKLTAEINLVKKMEDQVKKLASRDVKWWKILDEIWMILDAEPAVWIKSFKIVDESKARGLVKQMSASSGSSPRGRGPSPPYGVEVKLEMYGHDDERMTNIRDQLAANKYLKEKLPQINALATYINKMKDGVKTKEFTIVMLAKPKATGRR